MYTHTHTHMDGQSSEILTVICYNKQFLILTLFIASSFLEHNISETDGVYKTHLKQLKMMDSVQNKNHVYCSLSYAVLLGRQIHRSGICVLYMHILLSPEVIKLPL